MVSKRFQIIFETAGLKRIKRNMEETERSSKRLSKTLVALRSQFSGLRLLFTGALGFGFVRLSDNFTRFENRVRLATKTQAEFNNVSRELLNISQETRTSLEANTQAFLRFASTGEQLGATTQDILDLTERLNKAFIISGSTAQETQSTMIQLSQGFGRGVLRGQELVSVLEQGQFVADVIAKRFGVTRGELAKLGEQGKITSRDIILAFAQAREEIDERFAVTTATIRQEFLKVGNVLTILVGRFNRFTGVGDRFRVTIKALPAILKGVTVAFARSVDFIRGLFEGLSKVFGIVFSEGTIVTPFKVAFNALIRAVKIGLNTITELINANLDRINKQVARIFELAKLVPGLIGAGEVAPALPALPRLEVQDDFFRDVDTENLGGRIAESMAGAIRESTELQSAAGALFEGIPGLTDAEGASNLEESNNSLRTTNDLLEELENRISQTADSAENKFKKLTDSLRLMQGVLVSTIQSAENLFVELATGGIRTADQLREAFSQFFQQLAKDILAAIIRVLILKALEAGASGAGVGTAFGGFLASTATQLGSTKFSQQTTAPGNQAGGPLRTGQASVVGEQGPELFVPTQSGNIVPNSQIAGTPPSLNVTNVVVSDPGEVAQRIQEAEGEQAVLNVITKNREALKGLIA